MEKPEVNMGGDIPPEKIEEFLRRLQGDSGISPEKIHNLQSISSHRQIPPTPHPNIGPNEPIVDIYEENEHLHVVMELPGVEKKDIELLAAPKEISVNGRTISLPVEIDVDSARSRLKNGILQIKLKKKEQEQPEKKKLEIE